MATNFENAKRALSGGYHHSGPPAEAEFSTFLESLEEMRATLAGAGITYDLFEANPNLIEFRTPAGPLHMSKLTVLEENRISFAVVFFDPVEIGGVQQPDLWSLHLRCDSLWKHADGKEVQRDFESNKPYPFSVFEAVRNAAAVKLLRNSDRLAGG